MESLIKRLKKKSGITNCKLPSNAVVDGSAIMNKVNANSRLVIGADVKVNDTTLGKDVRINACSIVNTSLIGDNVIVDKDSHIRHSEFSGVNRIYKESVLNNVRLDRYSYIGARSRANNTAIGKYCSIGQEVKMCLGLHPSDTFVSSHPSFYSTKNQVPDHFADKDYFEEFSKLTVGNDVWIGLGSILMGGITIGDGAIIAAGSIVTKDVPPYAIVGGAPAKLIRYRFSEDQIEKLLHVKWWNADESWIRENYKRFHDIETFLSHH